MANLENRFRQDTTLNRTGGKLTAPHPSVAPTPPPRQAQRAAPSGSSGRYINPVSTPTGRYSRPAAPPVEQPGRVASIEEFLTGDSGYQQQLRQFGQSLADFMADVTRRRGTMESEYGLSKKALEDQRLKDLDMLEDDYGSRGLLRSGLYGKAVGDYEQEFGQRSSDLSRRQQDAMALLSQEQGQFDTQTNLQKQAAREAAIRRRAEQLGI